MSLPASSAEPCFVLFGFKNVTRTGKGLSPGRESGGGGVETRDYQTLTKFYFNGQKMKLCNFGKTRC